jgi:uncharacterized repeat protein (TIGR03843 family)
MGATDFSMPKDTSDSNNKIILEPPQEVEPELAIETLQYGEITLDGLMPWSSNYTFLGTASNNSLKFNFIYKPCQGERPLWDFDHGTLCQREVATYLISRALGEWPAIPPTVLRDGPHGPGSFQQFIHADYDIHYFVLKDVPEYQTIFQQFAVFDYLINNADRKGGHCLLDYQNKIWSIDHGLTFHVQYKLRTVIWKYASQKIPPQIYESLQNLKQTFTPTSQVYQAMSRLISSAEIDAFCRRLDNLLVAGKFPRPLGMRDYPYPSI